MSFDLSAIVEQAANESVDMSEASKGGGGATPPAAGVCIATLVGYIEKGTRIKKGYKGAADKKMRKATWIIELAGGSNPHTKTEGDNPVTIAKRININTWLPAPGKAPNAKSGFYKVFSAFNADKTAKIPAQCLGRHVKVNVSVEEFTNESGEVIKYGSVGNAQDGFRITPAQIDLTDDAGMPTGQVKLIPAPPVVSTIRCFLWDYATKEMWDSLFIEGEYEAVEAKEGQAARPAKTKNVIQEEIKTALDWVGSPMYNILTAGGDLDVEDLAEDAASTGGVADADPLAGML